MRISGLASGMDIDSIVSDMMKIKKMPLDKLKQEKQVMEWQRDDYREMNTLLLNFRSELTQMKLTTKYRTRGRPQRMIRRLRRRRLVLHRFRLSRFQMFRDWLVLRH